MSSKKSAIQPIAIELDKQRYLKYDAYAMMMIEERMDRPLSEINYQGFRPICTLLWAGLLHEDESLTVERVAKMVSGHNLAELTDAIQEAIAAAGWGGDETTGGAATNGAAPLPEATSQQSAPTG